MDISGDGVWYLGISMDDRIEIVLDMEARRDQNRDVLWNGFVSDVYPRNATSPFHLFSILTGRMMTELPSESTDQSITTDSGDEFPLRLNLSQWFVTVAIVVSVAWAAPSVWKWVEPFEETSDYRLPVDWSEDYWTYQRHVNEAAKSKIMIVGDSVVWGEYVRPKEALHACLNKEMPGSVFANGGVNGMHPLALQGLIDWHTRGVQGGLLLHCNLLWTSSIERDLQVDEAVSFNHPDLLPQFNSRIASYRANTERRLSTVIQERFGYRQLVRHWRVTNFAFQNIPAWSIEHPYELPWRRFRSTATPPKDKPHSKPVVWSKKIRRPLDLAWIDLKVSNQWLAFQRCVSIFQQRGNDLFVVVGPINEHCLTAESRERYHQRTAEVSRWLSEQNVCHIVPTTLPTDEYGDASHPLAKGYHSLALQLRSSVEFQDWVLANRQEFSIATEE